MRRRLGPVAAMAIIALISVGCSNAPTETDSGSSSDSGTVASSSEDDPAASPREQGVKFAECMRDNGVDDFPDPDASGTLTFDGVVNGSSLDPSSAAFEAAMDACKDLEPPGFAGGERSVQEQTAALEFAQCIRDNGVEDFPDPANGEPLVNTNRIPSAATEEGMTILHAAMEKCSDMGAAAGATGGQ